jgi:hypothetical protein
VTRDPLDRLREDVLVGPDVTDAVMARLGYRALPSRTARWRRVLHVGTCLVVIGASVVGVAWAVDLGWKARLGVDASSRRASIPAADADAGSSRWEALEESLRPLRRIVEEIEPPVAVPAAPPPEPPVWLPARAPFGEA